MNDLIQGTDEWHLARLGKVTASQIVNVMMKPTTAGYQNYLSQLVCERLTGNPTESFTSAAMQHGTDTEPQARAFYEMETGFDVAEIGFVDHPYLVMTGASPDGLIGDAGMIEIKCPQPPKHIKTLRGAKPDRNYMLQMQWQMICAGRDWCDFASFNDSFPVSMKLHVQRIMLDPDMAKEITEAVGYFTKSVDDSVSELQAKYGESK